MGTLTNAQLQSALEDELSNRTTANDPASITTEFLLRCLNWSYRHVSHPSVYRHRELETNNDVTLVAGQFNYPIDQTTVGFKITGVESVVFVDAAAWDFTTTRTKLRVIGIPDFMLRTHTTADRPSWYCVRGEELLVSPGPTATAAGKVVRMFVIQEPAALGINPADLTATTVLPSYWDEVLVLGAAYRASMSLGNWDAAEVFKTEYGSLINELTGRDYLTILDTRPAQSSIEVMSSYSFAERM